MSQPEDDTKPVALLGIHPCDLHAIGILDEVYAQPGLDPYYAHRREDALIVVLTCHAPSDSWFCDLAGPGPFATKGFDMRLTPTQGGFLVTAGTARGSALAARLSLEPVTEELVRTAQHEHDRAVARLEARNEDLGSQSVTMNEAGEFFNHPQWEALAKQCTGCGACTTVCPTCFCYDVVDYPNLDNSEVQRSRQWHSCLYARFHEMAAHPGDTPLDARLRQRLYHKWVYHQEQFGQPGCVGCGRCIQSCTVHIDPRQVLRAFRRDVHELV